MQAFCWKCALDTYDDAKTGSGCQIMAATLYLDTEDPEYPKEWTHDKDGRPVCTAFKEREKA